MSEAAYWPGVAADRVVGILAHLDTGKTQVGSGYLLASDKALTAGHCTRDKLSGRPALSLQVFGLSDGAKGDAHVAGSAIDIGLLRISWTDPARAAAGGTLEPPVFGQISRDHAAQLQGCETAGVPLWKVNPDNLYRQIAELHGYVSAMEGRETGELIMRVPLLPEVGVPEGLAPPGETPPSPWDGLSGALVFYAGYALGVVVKHEPWLGGAALTVLPVERIAQAARKGDAAAALVMTELGFSGPLWALPPVALPQSSATHDRLCLGVRAEGHPLSDAARDRLSWVIVAGLRAAGIDTQACARQDELDGRHVITLPAGVHLASTIPALLRGMELAARDANASPDAKEHVRIALALARSSLRPRAGAYIGAAVSTVVDMLGSPALRDRLRLRADAVVAIAFADDLYRLICSQAPGNFDPADFRPLGAVGPGIAQGSRGWLYTPASATPSITGSRTNPAPGMTPSAQSTVRSRSGPDSGKAGAAAQGLALAFAAVPVAGAASWLYSHHFDPGLGTPQTPADFAHATVSYQAMDPVAPAPAHGVQTTTPAGDASAGNDDSQAHSGVHHIDGGSMYSSDGATGDISTGADWAGDSG
jgi:hypothetical protein